MTDDTEKMMTNFEKERRGTEHPFARIPEIFGDGTSGVLIGKNTTKIVLYSAVDLVGDEEVRAPAVRIVMPTANLLAMCRHILERASVSPDADVRKMFSRLMEGVSMPSPDVPSNVTAETLDDGESTSDSKDKVIRRPRSRR